MAKTTIYIALAIGAQQPAYPAYVVFRSPYRFVTGKLVVLPEPDPIALEPDGTAVVSVDPGVWLVDEVLPTQVLRRAVIVPASESIVQYADLVEVANPVEVGFGPTWAQTALEAAGRAESAAAESVAARDQVAEIVAAIPTESDALALAFAQNGPARTQILTMIGDSALALAPAAGGSTVNIGDSQTQGNTDQLANVSGDSHGTYFGLGMKGRAKMLYNDGIGGTTSAQMLARFANNVLTRKPSKVRILAGTNDGDANTQTLPNVESMIRLSRLAGAEPILHTIPPFGMPPVPAPSVALAAAPSAAGGTLAAGTYQYKITSTSPQSIASKTTGGESLPSAAVSATTTGATGSVVIEWDRVPDAAGYRIYRSSDGGATFGLIGTAPAAYPAFRDTGAAAGATPPTSATAGAPTPTAADILKNARINNVIHFLAQKYGVDLIDFYALLVDGTTGQYRSGYATDGVHPTPLAQKLMGELAARKATGYPANAPYLVSSPTDPTNLYNNGLLLNGGSVRPSGWGPYGGGVGVETCLPDPGILGNAYQIADLVSGLSPWYNRPASMTAGFAPGDKIEVSAMIRVSGLDRGGIFGYGLLDNGSGNPGLPRFNITSTPNEGQWFPWSGEGYVRPGSTEIYPQWSVQGRGVTAAIAQLTFRNLTALGIA